MDQDKMSKELAAEAQAKLAASAKSYEELFPQMKIFARAGLDLLPPVDSSSVVHDNGSGPGTVTGEILSQFPCKSKAPRIEATDLSPEMAATAALKGVNSQAMDARSLGFDDNTFTHSFTSFVLFGMLETDVTKVISEIHRTLKPGGTGLVAQWADLEWTWVYLDCAKSVRADAAVPPNTLMTEEYIRRVLQNGGFAPEQVELKKKSEPVPWREWVHPRNQMLADLAKSMFTKGWQDNEKKGMDEKTESVLKAKADNDEKYIVTSWMAILKK